MAQSPDQSENPKPPPKEHPEVLELRAQPRRVTRFRRGLIIGIAGVAGLALFGVTWMALETHVGKIPVGANAANLAPKRMPDSIAALPSNYSGIKLGPPMTGDLGPSVVANENSLGLRPASLRPDPITDEARAETIRRAQQARQAHEAGVMVQIARPTATSQAGSMATATTSARVASPSADAGNPLSLDPSRDPNDQGRKLALLNAKPDTAIYNPHALQMPVSPYEILAGTIIPASLISGLNSDLPGTVIAQVTEDVRDTASGTYILLPRGSRLIGTYDSVVAFGQSRALVVWQRIIMPNGTSVEIDNWSATDSQGYAGLSDQVDYHTWALLKGVALSTLLGVTTQLSAGNTNGDLITALRQSAEGSINQAGQRITEKNLDVQPTLTVRPGWPLNVIVSRDLDLQPYREQS